MTLLEIFKWMFDTTLKDDTTFSPAKLTQGFILLHTLGTS